MDLWADLGWPGLAWPELRGLGWLTPRAGVSAGTAVLAGPPPHVTSDGGASPPLVHVAGKAPPAAGESNPPGPSAFLSLSQVCCCFLDPSRWQGQARGSVGRDDPRAILHPVSPGGQGC